MPTFVHGITARLTVGAGGSLSGVLESADMDLQRELAEIRPMGDTNIYRVAGLRNCLLTGAGAYDATVDALMWTAYDGAAAVAVEFTPDGTIDYTMNAWVTSYKLSAASNGKVSFSISLACSGDVGRA